MKHSAAMNRISYWNIVVVNNVIACVTVRTACRIAVLLLCFDCPAVASEIVDSCKLTVVCDGFGKSDVLQKDWGYSALVECDGRRILFDCGNDADKFAANIQQLRIDIAKVEAVVISHRHGDHTAGLPQILQQRPEIAVYTPADEPFSTTTPPTFYRPGIESLPKHMRYFDGSEPEVVGHGTAWKRKLTLVNEHTEVFPGVHLIPTTSDKKGSLEMPELSLVVNTKDGAIVITGCAHCGVEKVLESASVIESRIRLLVGGFHLVTTDEAEIERVAASLREHWKVAAVAPGHCTSELGFLTLQRIFGNRYLYAGVGEVISLP